MEEKMTHNDIALPIQLDTSGKINVIRKGGTCCAQGRSFEQQFQLTELIY